MYEGYCLEAAQTLAMTVGFLSLEAAYCFKTNKQENETLGVHTFGWHSSLGTAILKKTQELHCVKN